jgi:hypothetical protein
MSMPLCASRPLPKELESRLTQQFGGFIRRVRYSFVVQSEMKRNGSEILFTRKDNKCVLSLCFASKQTSKECQRDEANQQKKTQGKIKGEKKRKA